MKRCPPAKKIRSTPDTRRKYQRSRSAPGITPDPAPTRLRSVDTEAIVVVSSLFVWLPHHQRAGQPERSLTTTALLSSGTGIQRCVRRATSFIICRRELYAELYQGETIGHGEVTSRPYHKPRTGREEHPHADT